MRTTGSISNQELLKKEKQRAKLEKKAKKKQGQKIRRSVFGNSSEDKNNHNLHWNLPSRASSIENSQAWKDLFRDTININGDIVNGGVDGPEAMIGALVRHILLQVHHMREKWVSYQDIGVGGGSNVFSSASTSGASTQSEQEARFERARMMASTYADLDEGQALSIARDILLSCNRTESGGDTYYCTQSLLCNSNFAVLTPHGCDVDPIEIVVDVVESSRRRTAIRPCSSSSVCSVNSTTDSPASKEFPSNLYHHLSGINEGTGSATTSPRNNSSDNDGEEGFGALRDSTTVESDNSTEPTENSVSQPQQSHYPESLLNAAAATVKRGGRRVGDIEDYYDPAAQLMLQSDIPGAAAIPSSMLLMKEVSKRKKRLNQPGYIERSDSDTSIGESTSGDSKSNGSEKDSELDGNPSFVTPTIHTTSHHTPVYQINCDDDVTIAVSELTMDTVPQPKTRRNGSMTSTLRKNLGFSTASAAASTGTNTTDDEVSSPAVTKKRHSFFSSWANSKTVEQTPEGHGNTPSRGIFSSPQPHSHPENKSAHSSWRSSKTDDDDASSVTDHRNSRRTHHQHQDVECEEETAAQAMCIRIQVIVKSRYRLCNLDPQDEDEDTWANITGQFHQHFFLKSNSNGRPAVSDRFVTVKVDDPSVGY